MRGVATTRLSTKGQVVIPKDIRDALGLIAGTRFRISVNDGVMTLTATERPSPQGGIPLLDPTRESTGRAT